MSMESHHPTLLLEFLFVASAKIAADDYFNLTLGEIRSVVPGIVTGRSVVPVNVSNRIVRFRSSK